MPAYSHLLDEERDQIAVMRAAERSICAIARALQRAKSTVSRAIVLQKDGHPNRLPDGVDYDAGCRVTSTSIDCPTRKSRTSS